MASCEESEDKLKMLLLPDADASFPTREKSRSLNYFKQTISQGDTTPDSQAKDRKLNACMGPDY